MVVAANSRGRYPRLPAEQRVNSEFMLGPRAAVARIPHQVQNGCRRSNAHLAGQDPPRPWPTPMAPICCTSMATASWPLLGQILGPENGRGLRPTLMATTPTAPRPAPAGQSSEPVGSLMLDTAPKGHAATPPRDQHQASLLAFTCPHRWCCGCQPPGLSEAPGACKDHE